MMIKKLEITNKLKAYKIGIEFLKQILHRFFNINNTYNIKTVSKYTKLTQT